MGKLFIHLGPPKTATTSLQYFLQTHKNHSIHYGGVIQPRASNSESLSDAILNYCVTGEESSKQHVVEWINLLLIQNEIVIVSEEVFLLHGEKLGLYKRLERLRYILENIDTRLIFTIRNPEDAVPSFYQEIYKTLPKELKQNFNRFCKSDYALPYKYETIIQVLQQLGWSNIIFIDYDRLIKSKYSIGQLLGEDKLSAKVELNWTNRSKRMDESKRVLEDYSTLERIIRGAAKKMSKYFNNTGIGSKLLRVGQRFRRAKVENLDLPPEFKEEFIQVQNKYFDSYRP